jgi:hypothetical protein
LKDFEPAELKKQKKKTKLSHLTLWCRVAPVYIKRPRPVTNKWEIIWYYYPAVQIYIVEI